jgi:Effector-associated domain 10
MNLYDEIKAILDRIANNQFTEADIATLRQLLGSGDRQLSIQLGKYNVNIGEGKEIHIGDRIYYSWNDEALSALVRMIQFGDGDEAHLLVTKLNNARLQGEEGDRKTGSFYTYNIWLEDVSLENAQHSTENTRHIQQYTIKGKWNSSVYKEINAFGVRVDRPWGVNKKPYGNFTVKVEILNGRVTQIKVDADRYNDSANNYAADKAKELIQLKAREVLRFF